MRLSTFWYYRSLFVCDHRKQCYSFHIWEPACCRLTSSSRRLLCDLLHDAETCRFVLKWFPVKCGLLLASLYLESVFSSLLLLWGQCPSHKVCLCVFVHVCMCVFSLKISKKKEVGAVIQTQCHRWFSSNRTSCSPSMLRKRWKFPCLCLIPSLSVWNVVNKRYEWTASHLRISYWHRKQAIQWVTSRSLSCAS